MSTILTNRSLQPTTIGANSINYSTLSGSSITINTNITVSTIYASTLYDSTLIVRNVSYSTMTGSSITTNTISMNTSKVSLGPSTNLTYQNAAQGAVSTAGNWTTSIGSLLSTKTVTMSANGLYQLAVTQISTVSSLYLTSTVTTGWFSTLSGASGLPINTQTMYSAGALSATGQYGVLGTYGGYPYLTNTFGRSWYNANATMTPTNLYAYYPFENSLTDVQGRASLTVTGSVSYGAGTIGLYAVYISNPGSPTTATNYIRGTMPNATNFTITAWFKLNSYNTATPQMIFSCGGAGYDIYINNTTNTFAANYQPTNTNLATTAFAIALNTWYSFSYTFIAGGTSSLYLNGTLIGSATSPSTSLAAISTFSLGSHDTTTSYPFDGYIDDLRIYTNYIPNIESVPYSYFPFDNSTVDIQGNTTFTTYGSVSYVAGIVGNAISISNTAGGTATNYLQAPFKIGNSFVVSFNFNFLTLPASNTIQSTLLNIAAGTGTGFQIIYIGGSTGLYVQYYSPGGLSSILSAYTSISTNTWYNIRCVFAGNQAGTGTAIVYINNVQVASRSDISTINRSAITSFVIGQTLDFSTSAFNGYIDDLRIYDNASAIIPPLYLPFETAPANNSFDSSGQSKLTVTGSPGVVTGIVGANALNLANGGSSPATQYIRGSWTTPSNFSVNLWINWQTRNASNQNFIFSACTGSVILYAQLSTNFLVLVLPGGNSISTSFQIALNTWYNVTFIIQTNSTCSLYVNNALIGTAAATTMTSSGFFGLGTYDASSTANPFTGYIDDFKIYNYVVTPSPMLPMNYNNVVVSASGQYQLATATGAGLYISSNYGATWSQISTVAINGLWQGLAISQTGQYMLSSSGITAAPQSTSATSASWTVNGITWTASSSSIYSTNYQPWIAFNNAYNATVAPYSWAGSGGYTNNATAPSPYNTTTYGTAVNFSSSPYYNRTTSQTIYGQWLQIQTSIPLVMFNYTFACGAASQIPQTYYIVGSTDGTTWYPVHYASASTTYVPPGVNGTTYTSPYTSPTAYAQVGPFTTPLLVNYTGLQSAAYLANTPVSISTTAFPTTTNAYTYFRIVITSLYAVAAQAEIEEWGINFIGGQSYSTNYGSTWTTAGLSLSTAPALAVSGNGQYAISSNGQTAYLVSNYLAGFSTNTYTTPTLPSINANIVAAALSLTGQYMVIVTAGTTNNVYYSMNYGATFINITIGSTAMTSCTMSVDGAYITVSNATTVYTLNNINTGYSVAIGLSAGQQNQGQNAIAIGSQAATSNQVANSVVLNASSAALNTDAQGFYVKPVMPISSSTAPYVSMIGYGSDNQITQSNTTIVMLSSGNVGIGTTNPTSALHIVGGSVSATSKTFDIQHPLYPNSIKRLVHSSVEGPRCDLMYRGTTVLVNGTAQVNINTECTHDPNGAMDAGTFESLCTNSQIFLQNMTGYTDVTGTISGAILTITSQNQSATDTIGWLVIAERKDIFIKQWERTDEDGLLRTQYST